MFRDYSKFSCWKICNSLRTTFKAVVTWFLRLVNLEYRRICKAEGMFKSFSRSVTCTRELISIYMCYSEGHGIIISLSRLPYLVLYKVFQLFSCTLFLYGTEYLMCIGRSWWMIYKLRLPLHLQPLRQPQQEKYTRTRMLELRDFETCNTRVTTQLNKTLFPRLETNALNVPHRHANVTPLDCRA